MEGADEVEELVDGEPDMLDAVDELELEIN